jgi:hypothetical protein
VRPSLGNPADHALQHQLSFCFTWLWGACRKRNRSPGHYCRPRNQPVIGWRKQYETPI